MNKITLIGNLTRDPESTKTEEGKLYVKFTIAVTRRNRGETDFFPCIAWGKTAENIAAYLTKGSKAAVVGECHISSYTGRDGLKKYTTDVQVDECEFLGKTAGEDSTRNETPEQGAFPNLPPVKRGELPF